MPKTKPCRQVKLCETEQMNKLSEPLPHVRSRAMVALLRLRPLPDRLVLRVEAIPLSIAMGSRRLGFHLVHAMSLG